MAASLRLWKRARKAEMLTHVHMTIESRELKVIRTTKYQQEVETGPMGIEEQSQRETIVDQGWYI